jgi:hypothetical protein
MSDRLERRRPRLRAHDPRPRPPQGPVAEAELSRAKAATISSVLMNLEARAVVAEDIGRQILTYGERKARVALKLYMLGGRKAQGTQRKQFWRAPPLSCTC